MLSQKLRGERLALQRCSGASVVLAVFLIPLGYYRFSAVPSAGACPELPEAQPLPQVDTCPASSAPDAAARERFAAVFASYLRRHQAAVALLDAPDPWADPKAAAGLRLVVAQVSREVRHHHGRDAARSQQTSEEPADEDATAREATAAT